MMIPISGDQASYNQRKAIIHYLEKQGHQVVDLGCYDLEVSSYDFFLDKLCRFMMQHRLSRGIVMCGSGLGIQMGVNKYPGFRCGRCSSPAQVRLARAENDMNVLSMGGRISGDETCIEMVKTFLDTPFDPAYIGNVAFLDALDKQIYKEEYLAWEERTDEGYSVL